MADLNDERKIIDLTRDMVTQLDRILRMTTSEFISEFGCETERVDKAKIEKAVIMMGTLKFFIDQVVPSGDVATNVKSPIRPVKEGESETRTQLNG